ncbi:adrenocortical dysplasia protein homolog isoform X5 [Paroedura picta]|uniref:adrenocortical dysplasia protein homolog isoform X5 n=1 Tax=Paroedura picta TaxID=143630 RepID=UPI004056F56E
MTSEQSRYCLRKRRASRRFRGDDSSLEELDSELLDKIRPCYLTPWIVKLLLDYDESEGSPEAQYGQVLKVLNEASPHGQDGQDPAAVVYIADGRHYIHTVVPIGAIQTAKDFPPQSGFSSILGQFIILQNFRVCVKKAAKAEDSGFYFRLDCFHVTTMKRCATRQQDCNRQPSVLQKIKELWLRGLALQPLPSPEPSPVSDILGEIKQDKLCTLKRSVEECFGLLDTSNLLNSEQLAVYPDTKWQTERKQDKVQCQDIFTVPAKFLLIGAEDEAALSRSRPPKMSDTQPSLPSAQQMLLASTAEVEEAAGSSSYTPDDLQTRDPSSAQVEPAEVASPSLLPPDKEGISQKSRSEALNSTRNTSVIPDTDESIPSGRPLNNSPSHASMYGLSPILPSIRSTFLSKSGDVEENHPVHLQRETAVRGMGEKSQVTCRKCGAAKRKQLMPDEESVETPSRPLRISCKDRGLTSGVVFSKSSCLDSNQRAEKQPLKFVSESTPKKSRIDDTHVQPLQASAQSRCAKMHPGKLKEHSTATGRLDDSLGGHLEAQQQEHVRRAVSHHVYQPATAELCSQVHSTRISETLLGWARWVCRNKQKP